jgi:hypothetical protein
LKDEALAFRKIVAGKTRVFAGAPADWSFVVRKYLLSVIRLIQTNKFVFETGVGTNACSTQWQEIRDYLTVFGDDRMIAGDYGSFDKTMPPDVILAAYDIIYAICKEAGYSESDLLVVQGIAEDTAFPLVDFNGDLVQFYGSNPSGHPLTVIMVGLLWQGLPRPFLPAPLPGRPCGLSFRRTLLSGYSLLEIDTCSPSER